MGGGESKALWREYIHCLLSATGYIGLTTTDSPSVPNESVPLGVPLERDALLEELLCLLSALCAETLRYGMTLEDTINPLMLKGNDRLRDDPAARRRKGAGRVIAEIGPRGPKGVEPSPDAGIEPRDTRRGRVDDRSSSLRQRGQGGEAEGTGEPTNKED